jgi:magnesium-transporting ATPase (P-type)
MVIEEGVLEGRKVFVNILKYIRMGASSNFGNMFSVIGASYWLPYLPMAPIQILTNNLLYDFSQVPIPTLVIMAVGAWLPYSPLATTLGFVPLPLTYWVFLVVTLLCYVGLTQIIKMWLIRKSWV